MIEEKNTYNLYSKERQYRDETLVSFYFQQNRQIIKTKAPIDIDGERYRLDLETGEISNYIKKDVIESYNASLRRTIILMNTLLAMNDFDWFCTLTFDKDKIDRTDDQAVYKCYAKYINNLNHKYPNFGYMSFPERHEDNCMHFHLLFNGITAKQMGLVDSGNVCCHWATKYNRRTRRYENIGNCNREYYEKTKHLHELEETDGEPIYNVSKFAYGYTTVSRICSRERCNSYVKKYVEKALGSTEIFKKRFYYSRNLNVPVVVKKLIGADFERPIDILHEEKVLSNEYVKATRGECNVTKYNVLQIKIDNYFKDLLDCGATILSVPQQKELEEIFNNGKF